MELSNQDNKLINRIPFEWVIQQKDLMKPLWDDLSLPQQVVLKAFYGLALTSDGEKAIWAILNDRCEYDQLGFVTSIQLTDYQPKEYSKLVGLFGRRSGKSTHITAFAALYEILFGGHQAYVKKGQSLVVPYIATDKPTAIENMNAIRHMAERVDKLAAQLDGEHMTEIRFKNGFTVQPQAMKVTAGRGWAMPIVIMDEVGFWYTQADAANPDYEVERAVRPSQLQFEPYAKQFIISTPYVEDGLLWDYWNAGSDGQRLVHEEEKLEYQDALVLWSTTAAMDNPMVTRTKDGKLTRFKLEKVQREDPESFIREYCARFVKSIGGMIPKELLERAIVKGRKELTRKEVELNGLAPYYVAAMDPAFRHDSWAFSIGHRNNEGKVIQDVLRVWTPEEKERLNPDLILDEIAHLCKIWNITSITSDQYQLEALQQLGLQKGLAIIGLDFTNKSKNQIYGSLMQLLRNDAIELLDIPVLRSQLSQLQKRYTSLNQIQISAPPGKHDDVASVVAMMAKTALTMYPSIIREKKKESLLDQVIAKQMAKRREMMWEGSWN